MMPEHDHQPFRARTRARFAKIYELRQAGAKIDDIADQFGISSGYVGAILRIEKQSLKRDKKNTDLRQLNPYDFRVQGFCNRTRRILLRHTQMAFWCKGRSITIEDMRAVAALSDDELLEIEGIGKIALKEIRQRQAALEPFNPVNSGGIMSSTLAHSGIGTPYNASLRPFLEANEMPANIRALPVSKEGFPVPWFVAWLNGEPDFRVIKPRAIRDAWHGKKCWVCGNQMGRNFTLILGPMCIINRTISEPAMHRDCAVFSAKACPFLANPRMRRNEKDLPEDLVEAPGVGLKRNPKAVAVWVTRGYRPFKAFDGSGTLFTFDDPTEVQWFAEGRVATRAEVAASIDSGLPTLEAEAAKEGETALRELAKLVTEAAQYLPAA